ncbi:MAG TPA: hypothetical protein PKY44_02050 [Bacteroidales bacterium]|nr:hypothetical protein [Bacteroidales bacterium]
MSNIKNLLPNPNVKFHQGFYNVNNINKYIGDYKKVIYRSSLEKIFCTYCDTSNNVLKWSSELYSVKYMNPITSSYNNYYIDFFVRMKKKDSYKDYLVEIKPSQQLKPPRMPKNKTKKNIENYKKEYETYLINSAKFESADNFAKNNNFEFVVLTEKTIFKFLEKNI